MSRLLKEVIAITLLTVCHCAAQDKLAQVPKEVNDLVGTYTGSWTSYGLDANGQVVKQAAWTDKVTAENPAVAKDRAFVTTTDEMVFEGGRIPPMKVAGREGYALNSDGSLGEYFIETFGQTYRMRRLGDNVFAYTVQATPQELARIGVRNAIWGQHVLVKVITFEGGVETHNVTRLTTVRWKEASGKERTIQFASLQGRHQRQRN